MNKKLSETNSKEILPFASINKGKYNSLLLNFKNYMDNEHGLGLSRSNNIKIRKFELFEKIVDSFNS